MDEGGKVGLGHHMGVSWGVLAHFTSNTYPVNCCQVLRYSAAKKGNFRFSSPLAWPLGCMCMKTKTQTDLGFFIIYYWTLDIPIERVFL